MIKPVDCSKKISTFYLLFLVIIGISLPFAGFSKNKVQYKSFNWQYIQSDHFDVYFYEGGKNLAVFTAETAETAYLQIQSDFNYRLRNRIVFIVYNSHNDWQQTKVVYGGYNAAVKGVTELLKNRVVVKFEGDFRLFRHVIHHELVHAVSNDFLYNSALQSIAFGKISRPPRWFEEGLAEFLSVGWNTELDMMVRDAVINGYMPQISGLSNGLAYQGGASVYKFLTATYGREQVAALLGYIKRKMFFSEAVKNALGVSYGHFMREWQLHLRKEYYPEVAIRKSPIEMARKLTYRQHAFNTLNVSPTISPQGDKIAYLADFKGYQNIYLMDARTGKRIKTLIHGQRSSDFEELHFLRPSISFSPSGEQIALVAKNKGDDVLYLVNIKSGKQKKHILPVNGIYSLAWSPDGKTIAFSGNKNGQSDIYVFDLQSKNLKKITDDIFSDDQPAWSPDSKKLLFVSDRQNYLLPEEVTASFQMSKFNFEQRDVYQIDLETEEMSRLTSTPWQEQHPLYSPDQKKIAYVSDQNGISNLYIYEIDLGLHYPVTDVISGIFQISWDNKAQQMAFSSYYNGGFDVYLLKTPLQRSKTYLSDTPFAQMVKSDTLPTYARNWHSAKRVRPKIRQRRITKKQAKRLKRYVFTPVKSQWYLGDVTTDQPEAPKNKTVDGQYKSLPYRGKLSPEIVNFYMDYNPLIGFSGKLFWVFTDLLNTQKMTLNGNLYADFRSYDLSAFYQKSFTRLNVGLGVFTQKWRLHTPDFQLHRFLRRGIKFTSNYPLNKFDKLTFQVDWEHIKHDAPINDSETTQRFLPSMAFSHDGTLQSNFGAITGNRYLFKALVSPKTAKNHYAFQTLSLDYQNYWLMRPGYVLAFRLNSAASFGEQPQKFYLGGVKTWINPRQTNHLKNNTIEDVFINPYAVPLRGVSYYHKEGNRYALANLEFRFPLIQYLRLGFPPLQIFNVRGAIFYDAGTILDNIEKWQGIAPTASEENDFKDIVGGYGIGARFSFLQYLFKIDVAWQHHLHRSSAPMWYFSIGQSF